MQTLRQTLEHVDDREWLDKRSPLASLFFAGPPNAPRRRRQVVLTGVADVDERLRSTWHQWEARSKSPLQSALWEALCHLSPDLEGHSQAILLLTYFEETRSKQGEVIRALALGRSTYYRYLDRAVDLLGAKLVEILRPALQLELPALRPLVGRDSQLAQAQQALQQGKVVHLLGSGGMGKTTFGAHLANNWPHGVFWYTFRAGLTDHLDHLLFSLAYFLHQCGASGLWLHLNTNPQEIGIGKVLPALRHHLAELSATPPLLCFDEVDRLLPGDLSDSEEHARLRSFFEDLAHSLRCNTPLLLIGQRLLLEPESDSLIQILPLTDVEAAALLSKAKVVLTTNQQQRLHSFTRGNPLLLRLFVALHQRENSLSDGLHQLATPLALDWFMARLRMHLTPTEVTILYELAVFQSTAPRSAWSAHRTALGGLVELGLVDAVTADSVELHPAVKSWLYQQLPLDRRAELHLMAATVYAEYSRFTAAAYHYIQAGRPDLALWTWYNHRASEIDQGQSAAALELFAPLMQAQFANEADQRMLALLLAELCGPAGRTQEGLAALASASWPAAAPSTVQARKLHAELYTDLGEIDRALEEYRRSLESVTSLRSTEVVNLHSSIGRRALWHLHDLPRARREVAHARLDLELLQGEIEDTAGNYAAARQHYTNALALASPDATDHQQAKLHEVLGILEARYAQLDAAIEHIQAAGRYYRAAGNIVCEVGVTQTNLSYAYLVKRRYADAVAPAQRALEFFGELNHPYWLALNEANLAEAYFYLGDHVQAEIYAQEGLRREEVIVRPYCLYVLGHIRRVQAQFAEAELFCRQAIAAAEELQDLWGLAPAWRALAETYRDARRDHDAHAAFSRSLAIYRQLGVDQEIVFTQQMMHSPSDAANAEPLGLEG